VLARRLTAVVLALGSTAAIAACGDEYVRGAGVYSNTSTTPAAQTATTPGAVAPMQTTDAQGTEDAEGAEVGRISALQRREVREASEAARRFLAGYLPYSYGRRKARDIRSVSPTLRGELARHAPRVPPALAAKARPRVTGLKLSGLARGRVILLARIDDGQSRYAALLTVQRRGQRWAVSQVR
jgi:hypothetical protein